MPNEELNLTKLVDTLEDEKTGAHARKGFTYQDWWAAHKSFELLSNTNSKDFAIGVEIKEDVIIIDSLTNPSQFEFYQIKKKEPSNWSITGLLKAEKKVSTQEKSTLSKLYSRYIDFKTDATNLYFVSNAQLQIEVQEQSGKKKYYLHNSNFATDLDTSNLTKIENKIRTELKLEKKEIIKFDRLNFQRSNISALSPDISVIGAVTGLNEEDKFPFRLNNISSTCRLLASKFQSLGMNTDFASNFSQLQKRCLTKIELLDFLNILNEKFHSPEDYLKEGIKQLQSENYPFPRLELLKDESKQLLVHITDRTKLEIQNLFNRANLLYITNKSLYYNLNSLTEMINTFSQDLASVKNDINFDINYLKCITLLFIMSKGEIYNERYFNIPTTQIDSK